jgi:hypothetical protein
MCGMIRTNSVFGFGKPMNNDGIIPESEIGDFLKKAGIY